MLEITRELLEHYLRATGWTLDINEGTPWWLGKDWDGNDQRGFPSSWLSVTTLDIDVVVRITGHSKHLASLAFRLGLCAAAERDFAQEKAIGLESNQAADRSAALGLSGVAHLRDAGIEYIAWESARKR